MVTIINFLQLLLNAFFSLALLNFVLLATAQNLRHNENNDYYHQRRDVAIKLNDFLEEHMLQSSYNYRVSLVENGYFEIDGDHHSVNDVELQVASARPDMQEDSRIFQAQYNDSNDQLIIQKDTNGDLLRATKIRASDGQTLMLERLYDNLFIEYSMENVDQDRLSQFIHEDMPPTELPSRDQSDAGSTQTRLDRGSRTNTNTNRNRNRQHGRMLQSECSEITVIRVALRYESGFCNEFDGDAQQTEDYIEDIITAMNAMYKVNGFCKEIEICSIQGFCDFKSDDIYNDMVNGASSVCEAPATEPTDVLNRFTRDLYPHRTFPGAFETDQCDVAHLIYGNDLNGNDQVRNSGNVIGCAFTDSLCSQYAAGVNYFGFTKNFALRATLFAHELGHGLGAGHDEAYSGFIMQPSVCTCNEFSDRSMTNIDTFIERQKLFEPHCTATRDVNDEDDNLQGQNTATTRHECYNLGKNDCLAKPNVCRWNHRSSHCQKG